MIKLAEEFGWRLVGAKGDHHNFKHPESRFVLTIVHLQKDVPVGRAVDTVKKIRLERQVMRFLIMLEQTEAGFAVQAPDLAIVTHGETIEAAKRAACEGIRINLEAYQDAGQEAPAGQAVLRHLENPEFQDLLFTYVEVPAPKESMAA